MIQSWNLVVVDVDEVDGPGVVLQSASAYLQLALSVLIHSAQG